MRSVDFQDSFYKIPASERLQQQGQQQPGVNQEANIRNHEEAAQSRIDSPQQDEALENVITERHKRDREFHQREKRKNKDRGRGRGKKRRQAGSEGHIVDIEA